MQILGKVTVEDFYDREFRGFVGAYGVTLEMFYKEIERTKEILRAYDGDIYEYEENGNRGLCVIDSSGTVLKKRVIARF